MTSATLPSDANALLIEYTAALREQVETEHHAAMLREQELAAKARELAVKEQEIAAIREQNRIEQQRTEEFMILAQEVRTMSEKLSDLYVTVMSYTDDYITAHHKPIMKEIKWLASRVEVIMQLFSAITPEILRTHDPRMKEYMNRLFYLLEHPSAVTAANITIDTGDVGNIQAVENH